MDEHLELDQIFPGPLSPEEDGANATTAQDQPTASARGTKMLLQDIDSGRAFDEIINRYTARIRQLKA